MSATISLGVLGWPVAHSRSPVMQNAALSALGLDQSWHYQLLPVPPELFAETVQALPGQGFRGVNVTIPHKSAALALATTASDRARRIGAANTLLFEPDGGIHADNTDAPALRAELETLTDVAGSEVLVLGAGGTARAAVYALGEAGAKITVWNRTASRAQALCADLGGHPVETTQELSPRVIVNCTSVGLVANGDGLPINRNLLSNTEIVVDFVYREDSTPLLRAARSAGKQTIDGLQLLVRQGALAFELFTGHPAPINAMRAAVGLSSAAND